MTALKRYAYGWTRRYPVDPQVAGEIFQRTTDDEELLEEARSKRHPFHAILVWDDTAAAREFRLHQLRTMRRSLTVEVITKDRETIHIPAFVKASNRGRRYVPTLEAKVEELTAEEKRCWLQMKRFRERWKGLGFAREVCQTIADLAPTVARRSARKGVRP